MLTKLKWGIHPNYQKKLTAYKPIEVAELPEKVVIPVRQHIGAPGIPMVKKGDLVKKGTLIAADDSVLVSSHIHASISGRISDISNRPHPVYGQCLAIEIENDGLDEWENGIPTERDWRTLELEDMLELIKEAGVVGMGGAAFPAHVKLTPPQGVTIDTLIINAAECEPFLTIDHRVMLEYTERLVTGIQILQRILNVQNVVIGIENNKMDAVAVMQKAVEGIGFKVVLMPTKYPQGAEKILIRTLLGREVPSGQLPMDVGVVVQNVSTAVAICDAVTQGKPVIEKVVTVSGNAVKEPRDLLVRMGTSFAHAIECCGGLTCTPEKAIMGGPMMGIAQYTLQVPIVKGTSGILALSRSDVNSGVEGPCIRCGRCVNNCPMGLNPGMLSILGEREMFDEAKETYHLFDCIECGCCSYGCPSKRNIVQTIRYSKMMSASKKAVTGK